MYVYMPAVNELLLVCLFMVFKRPSHILLILFTLTIVNAHTHTYTFICCTFYSLNVMCVFTHKARICFLFYFMSLRFHIETNGRTGKKKMKSKAHQQNRIWAWWRMCVCVLSELEKCNRHTHDKSIIQLIILRMNQNRQK